MSLTVVTRPLPPRQRADDQGVQLLDSAAADVVGEWLKRAHEVVADEPHCRRGGEFRDQVCRNAVPAPQRPATPLSIG